MHHNSNRGRKIPPSGPSSNTRTPSETNTSRLSTGSIRRCRRRCSRSKIIHRYPCYFAASLQAAINAPCAPNPIQCLRTFSVLEARTALHLVSMFICRRDPLSGSRQVPGSTVALMRDISLPRLPRPQGTVYPA